MNAQPAHPPGAAAAAATASSPDFPAEHETSEDVNSSEYRLSDAYIAGMPAKRRKVRE
ncbi:unnamed protein product [Dibothriocephalus latus]|uniref:Uncharacterized protein n=1 Tax=Dibothriocephalus latus TaxID=60516 RepID=A0A3P7N9N6_DIBLA|nr:unnamed protein product [Dibothriocephalus latus]